MTRKQRGMTRKGNETTRANKSPNVKRLAGAPVKQKPQNKMVLSGELLDIHRERSRKGYGPELFVKIPATVQIKTEKDVSALFGNKGVVRLSGTYKNFLEKKRTVNFQPWCHLGFNTKSEAVIMKKKIEKMNHKGQNYYVDLAGSLKDSSEKEIVADPQVLRLPNLAPETSREDIREALNLSVNEDIQLHKNSTEGFALVFFKNEADAVRTYKEAGDVQINGRDVRVLFARGQ